MILFIVQVQNHTPLQCCYTLKCSQVSYLDGKNHSCAYVQVHTPFGKKCFFIKITPYFIYFYVNFLSSSFILLYTLYMSYYRYSNTIYSYSPTNNTSFNLITFLWFSFLSDFIYLKSTHSFQDVYFCFIFLIATTSPVLI